MRKCSGIPRIRTRDTVDLVQQSSRISNAVHLDERLLYGSVAKILFAHGCPRDHLAPDVKLAGVLAFHR